MTDPQRVANRWPHELVTASRDDLGMSDLPEDAIRVLSDVGVPRRVDPIFESTDVRSITSARDGRTLWQFGSDGETALAIDPRSGEVLSTSPKLAHPDRHANDGVAAFVDCLLEVSETRDGLVGVRDEEAHAVVVALSERLRRLDASALAQPDNWWATIVEQLNDGLL
jgi:hypothetical protein